jgi:hypothetical protein
MQTFKTKSGAELQVDVASFEVAIALVEAVKQVMRDIAPERPETEVGDAVASDPRVRKAVMEASRWVLYNGRVFDIQLLNDPKLGVKVWGDYFEVFRRVIEVNTHPFFPQTSSESSARGEGATGDQP